jgi:hypothetical protein
MVDVSRVAFEKLRSSPVGVILATCMPEQQRRGYYSWDLRSCPETELVIPISNGGGAGN